MTSTYGGVCVSEQERMVAMAQLLDVETHLAKAAFYFSQSSPSDHEWNRLYAKGVFESNKAILCALRNRPENKAP